MAFSMLKAKHMFMDSTKLPSLLLECKAKLFIPNHIFLHVISADAATIVSNSFQGTLSIYEGTDGALFLGFLKNMPKN